MKTPKPATKVRAKKAAAFHADTFEHIYCRVPSALLAQLDALGDELGGGITNRSAAIRRALELGLAAHKARR